MADLGQKWGLGKQAVSCLAVVGSLRQQNHNFFLLGDPIPPSLVSVTSELVWAEEV